MLVPLPPLMLADLVGPSGRWPTPLLQSQDKFLLYRHLALPGKFGLPVCTRRFGRMGSRLYWLRRQQQFPPGDRQLGQNPAQIFMLRHRIRIEFVSGSMTAWPL